MKKVRLLCTILLLFSLFGCSSDPISPIQYQLDGKEYNIHKNQMVEQWDSEEGSTAYLYSMYYDQEYDWFEIDYESEKDTKKQLSIYDIHIGDDITEVIQNAKIEKDYAEYDYEYDPYHDGCTEVTSGVYDGTIPDFEALDILDYAIRQRYDLVNDQWILHNYQTDSNEYDSYVVVSFDISGSIDLYTQEKGKVMSISLYYVSK